MPQCEKVLLSQQLSCSAAWVQCQLPPPCPCPLDVSPELCFDVSSDPQLSSILSSQNRHLSIYMHQGTFSPLPLIFLSFLSLLCLPFVLALLHSVTSIEQEDMSGREPPTASGVTCDYHYL